MALRIGTLQKSDNIAKFDIKEASDLQPKENQVVIKNVAIGVNELDVIIRSQLISGSLNQSEITPCYEACGVITAVGDSVKSFSVGDKVAYMSSRAGVCATYYCISSDLIVKVPNGLNESLVAASFLKGMLAHALTVRTFAIRQGIKVLVQNANNPAAQLISQIAKSRGAQVIATVNEESQINQVKQLGIFSDVLDQNDGYVEKIKDITNGNGVHVVYDSVGDELILQKSINSLCYMGMLVGYNYTNFNNLSIPIIELAKKSLFFTAPSVFEYKRIREEMVLTADELFNLLLSGLLKVNYVEYSMSQLPEVLDYIASGKSNSSMVLVNDSN